MERDDKITTHRARWTSAVDLKTTQYFLRTYENSAIRRVDLMTMDLNAKDIVKIR